MPQLRCDVETVWQSCAAQMGAQRAAHLCLCHVVFIGACIGMSPTVACSVRQSGNSLRQQVGRVPRLWTRRKITRRKRASVEAQGQEAKDSVAGQLYEDEVNLGRQAKIPAASLEKEKVKRVEKGYRARVHDLGG